MIYINNIFTQFLKMKISLILWYVLLIIINVQLFSKIDWKILPPMIFALKFFYTVTIRWLYPHL